MKSNLEFEKILIERAKKASEKVTKTTEKNKSINYVCFKLGDVEFYGIPFQYIDEIIYNATIVQIPGELNFIVGVVNCKSLILPVIDLKYFFHIKQAKEITANNCIIVLKGFGLQIGVLADDLIGDAVFNEMEIKKITASRSIVKPTYISGIINGNIIMLDAELILSDLIKYTG